MNRALLYLALALLKGKTLHLLRQLRRPGSLVGFLAVCCLLVCFFHYRHHEFVSYLVRREVLVGGVLLMLGGSVFKGFVQRGLAFEPPDVQFLFTSPFSQRQIVFYRLLPGYLYALVQGAAFFVLLGGHLQHPWVTTLCFILLQAACFNLEIWAAVFGSTLPEPLHYRIRWMILGCYALIIAVYLHTAWGVRLAPDFVSTRFAQLLFYPAVTLSDLGTIPRPEGWSLRLFHFAIGASFWSAFGYLMAFLFGAAASLWLALKLEGNLFETSLAVTTRAAERRSRLEQGRIPVPLAPTRGRSVRLPKLSIFHGVGAVVWKNLVVARRSQRELALSVAFALIYTGFLVALMRVFNGFAAQAGSALAKEAGDFNNGIAAMLAALAFFLQRTLSFDFRRDGPHLVAFRTLPVTPLALALAELAVPATLCVAFQSVGMLALLIYGRLEWTTIAIVLAACPAIVLGLNGVWNLHYLQAAAKRAGGQTHSASAVGTVVIVALSFLIFYPAGWLAVTVGTNAVKGKSGVSLGVGTWFVVQYLVDLLLLVLLARLFQRFEVSRDAC